MKNIPRFLRSAATFIGLFAIGSSASIAHDWYPISCCSERDCRALTEAKGESVWESLEGWELWDGRKIARRAAKPSPDGEFHLCETPAHHVLCFFAPLGA